MIRPSGNMYQPSLALQSCVPPRFMSLINCLPSSVSDCCFFLTLVKLLHLIILPLGSKY